MKSFIAMILVALFFVLALLFGASNEQEMVTISYFVAQGKYRLPVVLGIVFLAGFLISWLFAIYYITKMKLVVRKANKKIDQLETQLLKVDTNKSMKSNESDTKELTA